MRTLLLRLKGVRPVIVRNVSGRKSITPIPSVEKNSITKDTTELVLWLMSQCVLYHATQIELGNRLLNGSGSNILRTQCPNNRLQEAIKGKEHERDREHSCCN